MKAPFKRVTSRPDHEIVRDNIRRWCANLERDRRLNLKQIAEGVGIGYATLLQWRDGTIRPHGENLEHFATFCRIPVRCLHCNPDDTRCFTCKHPKPVLCPHSDGSCYFLPETPPPVP